MMLYLLWTTLFGSGWSMMYYVNLSRYLLENNKLLSPFIYLHNYKTLQMLAQQVDSDGRVSGAYSWIMPDGGTMAFSSSSGDHNMDPVPRPSHHGYNNNHLNNNKQQNFSDRNNLSVPTDGQQGQTNKRLKSHSLVAPDVTGAGYMMRIQGEDSQWIENSDEVRTGYYIT